MANSIAPVPPQQLQLVEEAAALVHVAEMKLMKLS